jgi:hypothetical protein
MGMRRDLIVYALGVVLVSLVGFFSPWWWLGFAPLGAGAIWAYYDVIDVEEADGDTSTTARPR